MSWPVIDIKLPINSSGHNPIHCNVWKMSVWWAHSYRMSQFVNQRTVNLLSIYMQLLLLWCLHTVYTILYYCLLIYYNNKWELFAASPSVYQFTRIACSKLISLLLSLSLSFSITKTRQIPRVVPQSVWIWTSVGNLTAYE